MIRTKTQPTVATHPLEVVVAAFRMAALPVVPVESQID